MVYQNLSAIIRGDSPVGSDGYQHQFNWATFDFAHVPVGLLSQVYEAFSWKWDEEESGATSVHYTPRNIAKTIVDEVFDGLENAHKARVLDPACGAGVFLVLAFRRLYREHWRVSGERPHTKLIRKILQEQLCGFDISDSALRLAALSLYLTAIELDPKPVPPKRLRFEVLDDLTLFNHRKQDDPESGPVIGSLGDHVDRSFDGTFDLVISNPPWTRIRNDKELAGQLNNVSKRVVATFGKETANEYQNPDSVPDLPFLWRSTQWCKPGGRIAMALPARTLFKDGSISTFARETIFRFVKFTGIVNCSNVRKTNVWPEMDLPFMIAFASNVQPSPDDNFWFICPQADFSANGIGDLRIDPDASYVFPIQRVLDDSWILKTLAVGTSLDEEIISKISVAATKPLLDYWRRDLGLQCKKGYNVTKNPEKDASLLHELLDLGSPIGDESRFTVNPKAYAKFHRPLLERTRLVEGKDPLAVFRAPLFLLRKSLPIERSNGNSLTSFVDIAFNQSFYGYSAKGHPNSSLLVRYLNVFAHSQVWTYYVLCTSPSLGTERPVFLKSDFDSCPIVPIENLNPETIGRIENLAIRLESDDDSAFKEIDEVIAGVYGLNRRDVEVISDTLAVRNPHDELGKRGSAGVSRAEEDRFKKRLNKLLAPFADRIGVELFINTIGAGDSSSYRFLEIKDKSADLVGEHSVDASIAELATKTGASRIVQSETGRIVVGILNQYRYWTSSRARLLSADILREYFSAFEGVR
ncbi:HsdM family class I SAM-dependent methyltransferase [Neorhodopirellula lusitana]|uniref:HsdM family class I SAM-dependent methyltransferase n=1 Tax=Neorhodopirellula lusitana TaxID=445327 RepID=UPI0024B690AF|nr:N-6 DNA methylase [Neorhodopirellula lusitana]